MERLGAMTKITMLLARGPGLPEGDLNDRLVVQAQLTAQGHMDRDAAFMDPAPWYSRRERPGQGTKALELVLLDEAWFLRGVDGDDDPLWAFEANILRPGEPVVLRRPDGEALIFRIVASEAG